MKINEIENFEFPSMVAKSFRRKKKTDNFWVWAFLASCVGLLLACVVFWGEVVEPHTRTPRASAMTNEEACAELKAGVYFDADLRAQAYCL